MEDKENVVEETSGMTEPNYKKPNNGLKILVVLLLTVFTFGLCFIGYSFLLKTLKTNSNNDNTTTTTTIVTPDVLEKTINDFKEKGYGLIDLNVDMSKEFLDNNESEYKVIDVMDLKSIYKSVFFSISLENKTLKLKNDQEEEIQIIDKVKELKYYADESCSYHFIAYAITEDYRVYVLSVDNSLDNNKFEELSDRAYDKIELYTKKFNHYCSAHFHKLIGYTSDNKMYDILNKNNVNTISEIEEKSGIYPNRDVYINGTLQNYKAKAVYKGQMNDIVLILGEDNNLYDSSGKKISQREIVTLMYNKSSSKILYLYEDGTVSFIDNIFID